MALFNRRQNDPTNVPEEIREYYQTERRERAGIAWLLALGTLLITVLLATGLFFAGRWAYRKIAKPEQPKPAQVTQNQAPQQSPQPSTTPNRPATPAPAANPQPTPQPTPAPAANPNPAPNPSAATPPRPAGGSGAGAPAAASTPLPSTGPAHVIAIFGIVSAMGYILHQAWLRQPFRSR